MRIDHPLRRGAMGAAAMFLTAGLALAGLVGTPGHAHAATGDFHTEGTTIIGPDGKPFIPVGANVGTDGSYAWGGPLPYLHDSWDERKPDGTIVHHEGKNDHALAYCSTDGDEKAVILNPDGSGSRVTEVKAWGWNILRVQMAASDQFSYNYRASHTNAELVDYMAKIVDTYTSQGVVVLFDMHDNPRETAQNDKTVSNRVDANGKNLSLAEGEAITWQQIDDFLKAAGARFKDNPYVWFNTINEPDYAGVAWRDIQNRQIQALRSVGNWGMVVVDAQDAGQDIGWQMALPPDQKDADTKYTYLPTMAPKLAQAWGNIVLSNHDYGAGSVYRTPAQVSAYIDAVHAAGLPLMYGEVGYRLDGLNEFGDTSYAENQDALASVLQVAPTKGVGVLMWSATHGDTRSLKASCGPFWEGGPEANLSAFGQAFWNYSHGQTAAAPQTLSVNFVYKTTVAGPNNDTFEFVGQGSTLDVQSDSGWANGQRTITFVARAGYVFETGKGTETKTFTDEG